MADHFVSIPRGVEGLKYSDFTTGTGSSGGKLELRVFDELVAADIPRKVDVIKALEAFIRFFENAQQAKAAGFVVKD
jgi:hypothetical protein